MICRVHVLAAMALLLDGCYSYSNFVHPDIGKSSLVVSDVNVPATGKQSSAIKVWIRRGDGQPIPGLTVTIAADKCTVAQPTLPTDANGLAQGAVSSGAPGEHSVLATISVGDFSAQLPNTATINFYSPADANNAVPLGVPLNSGVTVLNPDGSVDTDYSGTVHFTSTDPNATLPSDYTFTASDEGAHIWVGGIVLRTPGWQKVFATDVNTHQLISTQTFWVAAPPLAEAALQVSVLPSILNAGALTSITVSALDASGNVLPTYSGTVHFSSSDTQAVLPADFTFTTTDGGVKAFTNQLAFKTSGQQWVAVADNSLSSNQSHSLIDAGNAASLTVTGVVAGTAGSVNTVTVTAYDMYGNVANAYSGTVHFTSTDPNGTLPRDTTFFGSDAGSKTLTNGVALQTAGTQSVTVTDTQASSVTGSETGIVVEPGPATAFVLSGLPRTAQAGNSVSVVATAYDSYYNVATNYLGSVVVTSSDGNALLPPVTAFSQSDAGVHSFTGALTFATAGTQTVVVSDSQSSNVKGSGSLLVTAQPASGFVILGLNSTVDVGEPGTVTVVAVDSYGNVDTTYSGTVHFSSSDRHARLPADYTFANSTSNLPTNAGQKQFAKGVTLWTFGNQSVTVNDTAQTQVTGTVNVDAVIVTGLFGGIGYISCATFSNKVLKCWGFNNDGELGVGNNTYWGSSSGQMGANLPSVQLGNSNVVLQVQGGLGSTCALQYGGTIKCWGDNQYGDLGLGDTTPRGAMPNQMGTYLPTVQLPTGRIAASMGVGAQHVCVVLNDGGVTCWGNNVQGQLGMGDTTSRGSQPADMGNNLPELNLGGLYASQVASGEYHSCAVLGDSNMKCWGANSSGQLGLGDSIPRGAQSANMGRNLPELNLNGSAVHWVGAGFYHTCALVDNGQVKCWGDNTYGQLGLGDNNDRGFTNNMGALLPAVSLGTNRTVYQLVAAGNHNCALLDNGQVKCWGDNEYGNLGLGDTTNRGTSASQMGNALPTVSLGSNRFALRLLAGQRHTCAVLDTNEIKCWGYNSSGQLGLGDTLNRGTTSSQLGDSLPATLVW